MPTPTQWEIYIAQIESMIDGLQEQIPTKLSELENDNNTVQDANYVHTDNNFTNNDKTNLDANTTARHTHSNMDVLNNISASNISNWNNKADLSDIPDVSNFITKSVNDLLYYYTKTETYSKDEVNSLISTVSGVHFEVVQTLPTQDISTSTIYLVPKTSSTNDNYDEYIYVSNNWEHIGSTEVDLTGYATEQWVNTQISNFLTQSQIETLINNSISGKQNVIDSSHKLSADLVDDTTTTNKFVTASDKSNWNGKLNANKVKNETSTTAEDVYDVRYINATIGNIETLLSNI